MDSPLDQATDPELTAAVRGVALAARAIERQLDAMTLAQLRIMSLIARDPMRASALAEHAALSRPTLTGLLDGLAAKGWIDRRTVDGDRRGVTLGITESGTAALRVAQAESTHALSVLLDELPAGQRSAAIDALGALTVVVQLRQDRRLAQQAVQQ